jgi:uncharacterized membrane protein YccF (DUF307 family)
MDDAVLRGSRLVWAARSFLIRAIWFVLVGWWLSALCIAVGYGMCLTLVLIPVGLMVLNRIPEAMTLRRN